ncbi:kinesin-like protein KIN-7D, mitochondrial [Daucus carota subsp. sativus]|uniref:kinesin-like protein KIN-7D, mitochondrial n=1 Tax=Daucus carota subsp. sativus TaxID=79200 RepID=UPI0007EF8D0D|nr:PREDICTED: kinesin-like protein KIN-7D, mitochondrial isoform X1 [Daucus carota subsp. sativus]
MAASSSSSRGRSSSPFTHRKPSSPSPSTSSSFINGKLMPRSSSSSTTSFYNSDNASRSVTSAAYSKGFGIYAPVDFPASDEFVEPVDSERSGGDSISVTIRFRPLSDREYQKGDDIAWYPDGDKLVRNEYNPMTSYAFDRVFGPNTATQDVYDVAAKAVIKNAMEGINGTVFAYGVTSSGKTHTMHGDQNSPGIVPLAIKDVFTMIQDTPGREFLLRVSYLEIYNEVINDLLDPTGQNLRVREDAQGTYVEGIKEEVVLSPGHALSFLAAGEEHRHVGSNNFNLFSSRSHTIFTLMIESSAHGDEYDGVIFSQLNLIDLAGSESSKTETTGLRRKEGSYINKSLLTLGTVIGKLSEGKASHVPYRDSKLTRLLQSSLGGHGHVSLICTITPASSNSEETHNTLKFASRAKRVEINASRNKIIDEKSLIKKYQKEISVLKEELDQFRKGMLGVIHPEEIMTLKQKLEEGQVNMQSRLEEEEEAKAALMSRIQRLTKLILVSSKNAIPDLADTSSDQRSISVEDNGGMTMSDQMDLLVEQAKMLAGEIAFSTSTLKRLKEQCANDPENSIPQIQELEREIKEKTRQMRVFERRMLESGESSGTNASLVDMQQTVTRLLAQCNEKGFELEIKSADNRILQEQLENKCAENKELKETISLLQQKLSARANDKSFLSFEQRGSEEYADDLRKKIKFKEIENEKLKVEHVRTSEENSGLRVQNQKLSEEASYAKELASAAAVELKNLAGEVTKLSLLNAKLEKELLSARDLISSRGPGLQAGNGGNRKYNDGTKPGRRGRLSGPTNEISGMFNDDFGSWNLDLDDLKMELHARKQREASLEAALAEKEVVEDEYRKKVEEARKRETSLENDLANMWVLVAQLKKERGPIHDLNNNEKHTNGLEHAGHRFDDGDSDNLVLKGSQVLNSNRVQDIPKEEPLVARLKARMQEMKEKELMHLPNGDANSHVCKVCFESTTAAMLLPCRHFCLCKTCSLACSECPLCRTKISDRIFAFTS